MRVEDVHYIAVEGGGAGGLLVHPGVLQALESPALNVVRREGCRPAAPLGWAGSSSGSVISTLASCGYTAAEIALLASQEAFDMVFRLETLQLGEFAGVPGTCKRVPGAAAGADLSWNAILALIFRNGDPAGALAEMAHKVHASGLAYGPYMAKLPDLYTHFRQEQANRIGAILDDAKRKGPGPFQALAERAYAEHDQRLKRWRKTTASAILMVESEYPRLLYRLLLPLVFAAHRPGPSLLQILRSDFGLASGCLWRDYVDYAIAFARFRLRFGADLPSLELPRTEDMASVSTIGAFFQAAIIRAMQADYGAVTDAGVVEVPYDFLAEFDRLRHCTFRQHAADFYGWLGSFLVPPLIITGANISTQESHLFSALATPDFHVADAVRMATGLPPIFKPVRIDAADIPASWPMRTDRYGRSHYLEGLWVDGGLYYNSPVEVFRDAASGFSGERYTMGIGIGLEQRATFDNLTQFAMAFINMGYEANVSRSRLNLANFLNVNRFDVGFAKSKVLPKALEYYRLDAYWRTFNFFGATPP